MSRRPPRRCSRHDLAIAPDGLCVLCRRDSRASVAPVAVDGGQKDPPRWLGVCMVLAACVSMAWPIVESRLRALRDSSVLAESRVAHLSDIDVEPPATSTPIARKRAPELETASDRETVRSAATDGKRLATSEPALERDEQPERASAEREPVAANPASEHERNAAIELERKREQELRVQRRQERVKREQQKAKALASARRRVDITMYSTRWCAVCRRARAYMQAENIAFTELDVEGDKSARARQRTLNPRGSVPTIEVDDQVLIGFSAAALEKRIERAARLRLGPR